MKRFNDFNDMYNSNTNNNVSVFNYGINTDDDLEWENFNNFKQNVIDTFKFRADELLDDIIDDIASLYGLEFEDGENSYTSIGVSVDLDFDVDNFKPIEE